MQEAFSFPRPLSVGELLDRAFRLYRKKFGLLLLTAAVLLIPFGIVSGLLTGSAMVGYFDFLETVGSGAIDPDVDPVAVFAPMGGFFAAMMLVGLLSLVFSGVTTLALTHQEIKLLHDEKVTVGQGLRAGFSRLLAYIGMVLLQILAYIGVSIGVGLVFFCAIFALVAVFGGAAASFGDGFVPNFDDPGSAAGMAGIVIGVICLYLFMILLFLIPVAYFTARWSVAIPALVEQKLGPIAALNYSWNMTKGHVRRSLIYVVLLFILSAILVTVPAMVMGQLAGLFMLSSPESIGWVQSISTMVSSIFSVIWVPLYTAAYVMYYFDLRVRNEGYDLEQRIEKFESGLDPRPLK